MNNVMLEEIKKHSTLNPKLWDTTNQELKNEVREKILLIVDEFTSGLKEDEITINPKDIVIVGSNCSYNYTKDSDLDIHIIADMSTLQCPENLYEKIYSAYRSLFNKKLDIDFYGIPVELYVETSNSFGITNGIYSVLNDRWIKAPVAKDIPDIDQDALDKELMIWEDRYNSIVSSVEKELDENVSNEQIESIDSFIDDIYLLRKNGLSKGGEYSIPNLVFKECRNRGYLDNLKDLRNELVGKELSLESLSSEGLGMTKKKNKGQGWFVKMNAGDVEYNTKAFNHAMGADGSNIAPSGVDGPVGESLKESFDMPLIVTVEDIISGSIDNMSDGEIDRDLRLFKNIARLFKKRDYDSIVVLVNSDEYHPRNYLPIDKASYELNHARTDNGIDIYIEEHNGDTYLYFKDEDSVNKYIEYVDNINSGLNESKIIKKGLHKQDLPLRGKFGVAIDENFNVERSAYEQFKDEILESYGKNRERMRIVCLRNERALQEKWDLLVGDPCFDPTSKEAREVQGKIMACQHILEGIKKVR